MPYSTPQPLIDAVRINAFTSGIQAESWAAVLADGRIVVTWESWGQDGSNYGAYGRILDSNGSPAGSEFQANTTMDGSQQVPVIAALDDGGFIIAWQTPEGAEIVGQRFDANGLKVGGEFQISTSPGAKSNAHITALADGGFLAVWMANDDPVNGGTGIFAQRFDANVNQIGGEFQVNAFSSGEQRYAQTASLSDGSFVIAWASDSQDGSGDGISARRYSSSGNPIGSEFQLNTTTSGNQNNVSIEALPDGGFVASWLSPDVDGVGVFAQRFDNNGNKVGIEFQVNTTTVGNQDAFGHTIAVLQDGSFVITWVDPGVESGSRTLSAQLFDPSGVKIGFEFEIATDVHETIASVHTLPNGDLFFTWSDNNTECDVMGRTFSVPASGETWRGTGGNDTHLGTSFDDTLQGGAGQDLLDGGAGADTIYGGSGNDGLSGGNGQDQLFGEAGNDSIAGGGGSDLLDGGSGDDHLSGDDGNDQIFGAAGNDLIDGGAGNDIIEGGSGNDLISGDAGADRLTGGAGQDRLIGGIGNDMLTGNAGADIFVFDVDCGQDAVTDFGSHDTIEFGAALFADFSDVLAHATYDGESTQIQKDSGESVTLIGIELSNLASTQFIFV